jgi:hypothetical protein
MNYMQGASLLILGTFKRAQYVDILIGLTLSISREAKIEFGEAVATKLKLTSDGTKVLWPQPTNDAEDPQNVCLIPYFHILETLMLILWTKSGVTAAKLYS